MATAIFLITDLKQGSPFPNLQTSLRKLSKQEPTPWSLEYRPLRAAPATESSPQHPRFNHFISLAHHTNGNYSAIDPETPSSQPGQIVVAASPLQSIVRMDSVDEWTALYALVSSKMSSLWTARQQLHVIGGASISTGEFSVRIGEVRVKAPSSTSTATGGGGAGNVALGAVRAVVVQVQLDSEGEGEPSPTSAAVPATGGGKDDDDSSSDEDERPLKEQNDEIEETKQYLRDIWGRFGISGAREYFDLPKKGAKGGADGPLNEVRLWCEVLRPKT